MLLEVCRQVLKDLNRGRAQMMYDALDIFLLRLSRKAEQGEEARKRFVAALDFAGDFPALVSQHEAAILFVIEVTEFSELLDHAGDRGLAHIQGRRNVYDAGIALFFNQLVDAFEVVLGALARSRLRHCLTIKHILHTADKSAPTVTV